MIEWLIIKMSIHKFGGNWFKSLQLYYITLYEENNKKKTLDDCFRRNYSNSSEINTFYCHSLYISSQIDRNADQLITNQQERATTWGTLSTATVGTSRFHTCWHPGPSWACIPCPSAAPWWRRCWGSERTAPRRWSQSTECCCRPGDTVGAQSQFVNRRRVRRIVRHEARRALTFPHRYTMLVSGS